VSYFSVRILCDGRSVLGKSKSRRASAAPRLGLVTGRDGRDCCPTGSIPRHHRLQQRSHCVISTAAVHSLAALCALAACLLPRGPNKISKFSILLSLVLNTIRLETTLELLTHFSHKLTRLQQQKRNFF